ncbi:MAG: hypothetical protein II404_07490 [Prevotella sp.]|nr:hypothetical protein [Prevotella sp.]
MRVIVLRCKTAQYVERQKSAHSKMRFFSKKIAKKVAGSEKSSTFAPQLNER